MRISIWQQFSSNHSASYTIIGVFPSPAEAEIAAEKIRGWVIEIEQWWTKNRKSVDFYEPSPREKQLAQTYGFDWKEPVDWLRWFSHELRVPKAYIKPAELVNLVGAAVLIDHPKVSSTWQTGHQFANLITGMGGQAFSQVFMGEPPDGENPEFGSVRTDLTCIAPSEAVADDIEKALTHHLEHPDSPFEWTVFHPRFAFLMEGMSVEEYRTFEARHLQFSKQETDAWQVYTETHVIERNEYGDVRREFYQRNFSQNDIPLRNQVRWLRSDTALQSRDLEVYPREGREIRLVNLHSNSLPEGLIAVTRWMQSLGCEVKLNFRYEEFP